MTNIRFDLISAVSVVFKGLMGSLKPLRKRGLFGTPDEPIYFDAGESIPPWVAMKWPLHMGMSFPSDVETYYEDGSQIVRTLQEASGAAIRIHGNGWDGLIYGAPTQWINSPRPRPRARLKALKQMEAFG